MRIEQFLRTYGLNKLSRLKSPVIIKQTDIEFPYDTNIHYMAPNLESTYITKKISFLENAKKVLVHTSGEYKGDTEGSYRYQSSAYREFITENDKQEKDFIFLKPNKKAIVNKNGIIVYNYSSVNSTHIYTSNPLSEYYQIRNLLNTIVYGLNRDSSVERNLFLNVVVRKPQFSMLERYLDMTMTSAIFNKLESIDHIFFIELWKLLSKKHKEQSIFSKLTIPAMKKTYLLFTTGNKCTIANLYDLVAMVKEHKLEGNLKSFPEVTARKLVYFYLNSILMSNIHISSGLNYREDDDDTIDISHIDKEIEDSDEHYDEIEEVESLTVADTETIVIKNVFTSIEDVKNKEIKSEERVSKTINMLLTNKLITKNNAERMNSDLKEQNSIIVTLNGVNKTIGELKKDIDTKIEEKDIRITPTIVAAEDSMLGNSIGAVDKKMINQNLQPYIVKSMLSIQNEGFVIRDFNIEESSSVMGTEVSYTMWIHSVTGGTSSINIKLPKIEKDGTFKISTNTYTLRKQKADLPIRKIKDDRVALTSFYSKIFVTRAATKHLEIPYYIKNVLANRVSNKEINNLVLAYGKLPSDLILPQQYTYISKYVKSFNYKDYVFNFMYSKRNNISEIPLNVLEKHGVLIGTKNNNPITLTIDNRVLEYSNKKFTEIGELLDILEIDKNNFPISYVTVDIYKKRIPIVVMLSYYIGLSTLLKMYNIKYELVDNARSTIPNSYTIKFLDKKLHIERSKNGDLLFGGLNSINKITSMVEYDSFEDPSKFSTIFNLMELNLLQVNEIKMLETLFVDPMTRDILKEMKEPLNFEGLLIRAIEMLADDNYVHPNDISGIHIKGYDRVAGMIYKELTTAIKEHKNKSYFSKSKITLNPYNVTKKLLDDSTSVLVDYTNPIALLKQNEDVTTLGMGGRKKTTMSKETRILHESEIGIISEAGKDSGDVGIGGYLSANPSLTNSLGVVDNSELKKGEWSNILSTSAMIAPFSIGDDVKRVVFTGVQNSHVIATDKMSIPYVRTGYESIIANRMPEKFASVAEEDGVVSDVSKDYVTVKYKSGSTKKYKLFTWKTTEKSNLSFKHNVISNVVKGTKVYKDYVLTYDESFFAPDVYDKSRVVYRQGGTVKIAFQESMETWEDSISISNKLTKDMAISPIKSKSKILNTTLTIDNLVSIGDKVEPNTTLFIISDRNFNTKGLDKETMEIIQNIKSTSPKSGLRGVIEDIRFFYNCELEDLSEELQYYIDKSDKRLKKETGYTGKVNSGYSINGKPLGNGEIELKIFIRHSDDMAIGDKAIVGNQLKCTVGDIMEDTYDENGESIDAIFSIISLSNRIVTSPTKIGLLTTHMKKIIDNAVGMYFK